MLRINISNIVKCDTKVYIKSPFSTPVTNDLYFLSLINIVVDFTLYETEIS